MVAKSLTVYGFHLTAIVTSNNYLLTHIFLYALRKPVIPGLIRIYSNPYIIQYVLLKALLPVYIKYTTRGESRVANIAQVEPSAIFVTRPSPRELCVSYKRSGSALSVLLYFTPTDQMCK